MTTKIIEKTIIEKQTLYVTADGMEWEKEEDAKEWEKGVQYVAEMSWKAIPKKQISTTDAGVEYSNEDEEAYVLTPRNHEDIIALENYVRVVTRESFGFDDSYIGKPIIMNFGYDRDWCSVYIIEDHINRIKDYLYKALEEAK